MISQASEKYACNLTMEQQNGNIRQTLLPVVAAKA
jgi:hypothetical protein